MRWFRKRRSSVRPIHVRRSRPPKLKLLPLSNLCSKDKSVRETAAHQFDLIHFKYGEALMTAGLFDRAVKEFLASADAPGAQQGLATMAHLYAARALDLAGKRNDALNQYRAVLARPNVYDAHEQAQTGLKEAFKRKLT